MDLQRLYFRLPIWAQEWALYLYAYKLDHLYYGLQYPYWIEQFCLHERISFVEMQQRQIERLQQILSVAFMQVPHFRRLAEEHNWRASQFTLLSQLAHLPIMEKAPIRQDPWQFVSTKYPREHLWLEKTSGTTGTALLIYWPREMLPWWWALHETRVRRWAGVGQDIPRAMVGGRPVVPGETIRPPYWRYNRRWHQLYLSSYHISPSTAPDYIEALKHYGSQWITGYGSAISLLGEHLREHPETLQFTAALTSGDTVSLRQRQAIEEGFGCRVFDYYGSAEGCCVISECESGRYHVQPEAGILEILDEHGNPCPPGVDGEFICTGLGNDVMPLIRYRTGDYGCWSDEQHCPCGRQSPLIDRITGRTDDYLELSDGRRVGRLSTAMKKAPSVKQAQIVQDASDHAWLLVVPEPYYLSDDGERLKDDIFSRIGVRAIHIDVCPVPDIPPTRAGKHVLVRRIVDDSEALQQYRMLIRSGGDVGCQEEKNCLS